jgi:hypothetical protein
MTILKGMKGLSIVCLILVGSTRGGVNDKNNGNTSMEMIANETCERIDISNFNL